MIKMEVAQDKLKVKTCIVIRFYYHGVNECLHFPVKITEGMRIAYKVEMPFCGDHGNLFHHDFDQLTFRHIMERALPYFRDHKYL